VGGWLALTSWPFGPYMSSTAMLYALQLYELQYVAIIRYNKNTKTNQNTFPDGNNSHNDASIPGTWSHFAMGFLLYFLVLKHPCRLLGLIFR